jgi:hypothetical protein
MAMMVVSPQEVIVADPNPLEVGTDSISIA